MAHQMRTLMKVKVTINTTLTTFLRMTKMMMEPKLKVIITIKAMTQTPMLTAKSLEMMMALMTMPLKMLETG